MTLRWVFDELPPSGARRGGDPASHVFAHDLDTFVREVVQNANDQAVSWPEVRFQFSELRGRQLGEFLEAAAWPSLAPHLRAAASMPNGAALAQALESVGSERRLLLLRIEDRNTEGLTGDESEGESHFRALCKDTLFSHKASDAAGGSYGLGKSVLWAFSGLSAVIFNSVLVTHGEGQQSPRLIGRAELPSHAVRAGSKWSWLSGSGWLGAVQSARGGERAESVWGEDAAAMAESLHLAREDHPGTSILILGFRDPTSEGEDDVDTHCARMRQATLRYFWPAMLSRRRLRVRIGGDDAALVQIDDEALVAPFVAAYRGGETPAEELAEPGDVVVRRFTVELPPRRDEPDVATRGEAELIVRLADDDDRGPLLGRVALFRGPGMVVRYWDRRRLAVGMRPFHALLRCGHACREGMPTPEADAMEHFLRAAEPPGHDDWLVTPRLKQRYQRGYAAALKRLRDRVDRELRELLITGPKQGKKGPERLQKRFPIGNTGGRPRAGDSPFRFKSIAAHFDGVCWHFEGTIEPTRPGAWRALLSLHQLAEDGRPVASLAIDRISLGGVVAGRAEALVKRGLAHIEASDGTQQVAFQGQSDVVSAADFELGFELAGKLLPPSATPSAPAVEVIT